MHAALVRKGFRKNTSDTQRCDAVCYVVFRYLFSCDLCLQMSHWFCLACDKTKLKDEMSLKPKNHRGLCKKHYNQGVRMSDFESSSSQQQQFQRLEFLSHQDHEMFFPKKS